MSPSRNPFAGSWTGKWEGRTYKGSWKLIISDTGQVTGETDTIGNPVLGKLHGRISETGELSYSYTYKADRTGRGNVSLVAPDGLFVQWRDTDDGFPYEEGTSRLERTES